MSISRRKFVKAGTVAGLAAGISLKSALLVDGQSINKGRDGNPLTPDAPAVDLLGFYNQATFAAYLGSIFVVNAGIRGSFTATLTEVQDRIPSPSGGECFSLVFQSVDAPGWSQGTYEMEHSALGSFPLFLVPGGNGEAGQYYVAIINRLPDNAALTPSVGGQIKRSRPGRSEDSAPVNRQEFSVPAFDLKPSDSPSEAKGKKDSETKRKLAID